jgi:plastocyanin
MSTRLVPVARAWHRRCTPLLCAVGLSILLPLGAVALGSEIHEIVQADRKFRTAAVTIARGDLVRFTNDDPYVHQIYVDAPNFQFESNLQPPAQVIDVRFPVAGTFQVMCHIHPTMHLTVTVQ